MKKIAGIGNALVDILIPEASEELLGELGLKKGSMTHILHPQLLQILERLQQVPQIKCGGGSAANTIHALALLGQKTSFIGKIGRDQLGDFYLRELQEAGVDAPLFKSPNHTGCAIGFITPDAERTFATYLGAAIEMQAEEIVAPLFADIDIVHVEGYLVQDYPLIEKSLALAREKGCLISLDLSSFNVVAQHHDFFRKIVQDYADIVFANEQEGRTYSGETDNREILRKLAPRKDQIGVLKLGKDGSLISRGHETIEVPTCDSEVKDTTGAGDLYASGFFLGYMRGCSLALCGTLASYMASHAICDIGARIAAPRWPAIRSGIEKIIS